MITNGSVTVEDGLKAKEEYAPARKVNVMIAFSVPEGADGRALLDEAGAVADQQVKHLLGKAVAPVAKPATTKQPTAAEKKAAAVAAAKTTEASKEPEKTKADLEREAGLTEDSVIDTTAKAADADDLTDLLGDTAPAPVTDKEISDACISKADKMKSVAGWEPKKIRLLVEKYVGAAGAKFAQVPAVKRHDFLKELGELK